MNDSNDDSAGPIQSERLIRQYLGEGRYLEAKVVAKKSIATFPPGIKYRLLLAEIFEAEGKRSNAEAELRAILDIEPNNRAASDALSRFGER